MASCDWQKFKSGGEAKAMFRHCDADERLKTEHQNTDIDKSRTHLNMSFGLFEKGYTDICDAYDNRIEELDRNPGQNKRKDRITLVGLSIPAPEGMDDATARDWFRDTYNLLQDMYGDNVLGGAVHFDEVHAYIHPDTHETVMSRPAMHAYMIPVKDGKLNAKQIMSRKGMVSLNNAVEAMTAEHYPGYKFQTGEKKKSRKSVEELKRASDEASIVVEAERKASEIIEQSRQNAKAVEEAARAEAARYTKEQREQIAKEREAAKKDAVSHAENVLRAAKQKVREKDVEAEKRLKMANETLQRVQRKEVQLDNNLKVAEQIRVKYENAYDSAKGISDGFAEDQFYRSFQTSLQRTLTKVKTKSDDNAWNLWGKHIVNALNIAKAEMKDNNLTPKQQFQHRVADRGAQASALFSSIQGTQDTDDYQPS